MARDGVSVIFSDSWQRGALSGCGSCSCPQITPCNPSVTRPVGHKEQYDMLTRISHYLHSAMGRLNFSIVTLNEPEKEYLSVFLIMTMRSAHLM